MQSFWTRRDAQADKQKETGKIDAGIRGAVTTSQHMSALEQPEGDAPGRAQAQALQVALIIERTHSWLQNFRRLIVRYERKVKNLEALVHMACALVAVKRV